MYFQLVTPGTTAPSSTTVGGTAESLTVIVATVETSNPAASGISTGGSGVGPGGTVVSTTISPSTSVDASLRTAPIEYVPLVRPVTLIFSSAVSTDLNFG